MVCFANKTREKEMLANHWLPLLSSTDQGQYVPAKHTDVAKSIQQNLDLGYIAPKGFCNIEINAGFFLNNNCNSHVLRLHPG